MTNIPSENQKKRAVELIKELTTERDEKILTQESAANWLLGASAALLLWLMNSFDKFVIDGELALKWMFLLVCTLFSLALFVVVIWRFYLIADKFHDGLLDDVHIDLLKKVEQEKDELKTKEILEKMKDINKMGKTLADFSKHIPEIVRVVLLLLVGGTLTLALYFILFIAFYR